MNKELRQQKQEWKKRVAWRQNRERKRYSETNRGWGKIKEAKYNKQYNTIKVEDRGPR